MNAHLTIDKAGGVVIPRPLREQLRLEAGDTLEMESSRERITLRPTRGPKRTSRRHHQARRT